jgi:hypothetical protein
MDGPGQERRRRRSRSPDLLYFRSTSRWGTNFAVGRACKAGQIEAAVLRFPLLGDGGPSWAR